MPKSIFIPISLLDVFELIEDGRTEGIFFEDEDGDVMAARARMFTLKHLPEMSFYKKIDYTTYKEDNRQ